MSLSKELQSPAILREIKGASFPEIKEKFLKITEEWYKNNSDEEELITSNLKNLGLNADDTTVKDIEKNIAYHYAEKIFPHSGTPKEFAQFIDENIDYTEAKELLSKAKEKGGILIATPHFGGVEFAVPTVARMGYNASAVLKFSTQNLSDKANAFVENMAKDGEFSKISFIELGKPETNGALEMASVLRRGEVLFTVFDEETEYSIPVDLFGKKVEGGAGLQKLIKFAGNSISIFNIFMIRVGGDQYKMKLVPVNIDSENPIQDMYNNLETILKEYLVQWYFLHEDIPFVESVS